MRGTLNYSNVMSTIAVFLALGGGSFAVAAALDKDSVKSKQVKDESLLSKDLKDGAAVSESDLVPEETTRVVGTPGNPLFLNGGDGDCQAQDYSIATAGNPVGFYRSANGRVHLQGVVFFGDVAGQGDGVCDQSTISEQLEDARAFVLPEGYRPERLELLTTSGGGQLGLVFVGGESDANFAGAVIPAGSVIASGTNGSALNLAALTGLSFRAGDGVANRTTRLSRREAREILGR